jgi:hypothetical protein
MSYSRPWLLEECVAYPLYVDLEDSMGPMVLDQEGKSLYNIWKGQICPWCELLMSQEEVDKLKVQVRLILKEQ